MRKMKKSLKIIISLACVFAVAIASVVTAVVLHKRKKNEGGNPPSAPAYALTASQIELGKEINGVTSTSISSTKLQPMKYSEQLDAVLEVDKISYLDKSIAWSTDGFGGYTAYILDREGNPTDLLTRTNEMSLVRDGYNSSKIDFMGKNHFSVLYTYSENDYVRIVCSVEDNAIVFNKSFTLVYQNGYNKLNGDIFRIAFDKDYFVYMTETSTKYEYEFYDYIADYSDYVPFKLDVNDVDEEISCRNGVFVIGEGDNSKDVAARIGVGEFGLIQDSDVSSVALKNAIIVETKSELSQKTAKSELVDGKYYSYSYKFLKGNEEKEISLSGLTKISSVSYSGDKYFGVFMQGVDKDNKLEETGLMVYFDYDLNVVAKYSANSAYTGRVMYSNDEVLLTGEGLVSGKSSSDCIKTYDFSKNDLEFVSILSTGNIVLKDSYDNLHIYDLSLNKVLENGFDRVVSLVDDENLIYAIGDNYYRFNIKTKVAPVKINYEATDVTANTSMYFVKGENDKFSLMSGSQVIKDQISSYETGDNYLTYYANAEKTTLYFVDKNEVSNVSDASFTASAIYGGSSGSSDRIYGAGATPESIFDQETEWYDYDDKVVYEESTADPNAMTYKFTHCIQDGFYSKTNFVDYLEIRYKGEGGGTGYLPYRVYYRVDIVNGNPQVKIISKGHHRLAKKELTGTMTFDSNCIEYKGKFYAINAEYALGVNGAPNTNIAYSMSYDYKISPGGNTQYLYRYTASTATSDGSGLFFHEDAAVYGENRICKAEVYGDSIRVTIYFDFKYTTQKSGETNSVAFSGNCDLKVDADANTGYTFDKTMLLDGAEEKDYYNNLYYQSVVIGVMNENKNFYTDIIGMSESENEAKDEQIITDYYVENHLKSKTFSADSFNETLVYDNLSSSLMFNSCISSKTYLNDPSNIQSMILGGKLFKTNIVGAQIVGITSPKEYNHKNITIKSLYDTSVTSGSRNYFDDQIEFRLIPLGATEANGEENADSMVESKYLKYDTASESYVVSFDNTNYIYTAGGLNTFRYIYCIFEPQTFYVKVDYNASGAENSFGNEIDYLQSYLGMSVGLDYRNDYVQYNKSWVYRNVEEADFGDYNNANEDKYYPFDFTNVETRQEVVDLVGKSNAQIEEIRKKNENSAKVYEYKAENERYFYIVIDGVRYYFQKNYYDETSDYSKPFSYMYEYFSYDDSYIFTAYKNIADLNAVSTASLFGKYKTVLDTKYYTEDEKYLEDNIEEFGIYFANAEKVHIRIPKSTAADDSYVAYYHEINVHQRDDSKVVYDGYYSFNSTGDVVVPASPDPNKKYTISETFSFMYTDNILLTRLPQHTHYDFIGWKVNIKIDENNSLEYIVDMTEITSPGININTNLSNTSHPFLAEYEGGLSGKTFYDLWRKITTVTENNVTTTTITWKNTIENPITITAQWKAKQCDVEAVLYVKDGTKYNGLEYEVTGVGAGYTLSPNFNIANNATNAPVFKKGTENLDQKKKNGTSGADGILDFSEDTKFEYGKYQNFAEIGALMLANGFSQTLINTTGLSCQFIGWAFYNKDGSYVSIINNLDPLATTTLINEYIGDTTTITIYAYYTVSRYNFFLRFHSMGGATLDGGTKSYYSDYNYTTGVTGNGQIYNAVRNPAVYQIELKDATNTMYSKAYCTGCGNASHSHNTLEINGSSYGVDVKDETNPFYVGNSVEIKIALNEQYYTKKIVFNNIVLRNDSYGGYSQYLDVFDLTFTYTYSDSGGIWEGEAVSKLKGYTLPVTALTQGVFKIGNGTQNNNNNKFTINQTTDSTTGLKYVTVSITNLSYPGIMNDYNDYKNQRLTGIDGFTLNVYPESYTIETEKVEIYAKDDEDKDVGGPFNNNNAIMVSSQPLTNIEGKDLQTGQPAYIWLGTSKYMFLNSWNTNQLSGYYLMSSDGSTNAVIYNSYTYEQFVRQNITKNANLFVYYDSKEHRIYYPAQYSSVGNVVEYQTTATLTAAKHRYYFEIDGVNYFINFVPGSGLDILTPADSNASTFLNRYALAHTTQTNYNIGNFDDTQYKDSTYFYEPGKSTICVYYDANGSKVTYRVAKQSDFAIGYNNTRVLAIDPEQEQVYMSERPSEVVQTTNYELNYYLSSMTVGGTTISFNKLTRDVLTYYTDANGSIKTYGLLRTTTSVNVGSAFTRQEGIYGTNLNITQQLANGSTTVKPHYNVISFLGKQYIIQDAYKLKISAESGKVGATDYFFYLTRSDDGYTKYFLIYDESTTNLSDLKQNYSIKLTFKQLNRNLTIVAEEEDLYDASNRSFEVSYAEDYRKYTDGSGTSLKYGFDYDNLFGNVIDDENFDFNGNAFYEVDTDNDNNSLSSKITNKSIRDITSLKWQSSYEFTPSTNRRLKITAKSGYIIKYIKVYVGEKAHKDSNGADVPDNYKNFITFNFINSSLDDLFYYPTGGNYSFSSVDTNTNTLISYIGYNIQNENPSGTSLGDRTMEANLAYGYKLLANETYGLYYSNFYDTAWAIGAKDTLYFDHLYLMLSGLYEDVKIEFATTSYSEYMFESGESDTNKHNPLINEEELDASHGDVVYDEITLPETFLNLYTMKYDTTNPDKLVLDETLLMENKYMGKDASGNDAELPIFTIRYYYKNSINNIKKNSIRVIFFGTGSKIKHGVHFLATHQDYSVYFTNGRYYNESLSSLEESAFKNLEAYSGRTASNDPIAEATRNRTNKLVYMYTGGLHEEDADGNYTGFFVNSSYIVRNESNFKFFMATTAFVNTIGVRTDSYLYNHVLTTNSSNRDSTTYQSGKVISNVTTDEYAGKAMKYGYPQANPNTEIVMEYSGEYFHYQLDTTHKRNSWFNDSVLSNIQLFSYLDDETDAEPMTWANREAGESQLTRVEMGGLNFNWKYYDIAGYYLKYIMIKIADIETYFVIDLDEIIVDNNISDGETKFLKTIRIYDPNTTNARSYDYRFNLYYHKEANYGYYQLYPVLLTDDTGEIDIFQSVSLMANDIYISFLSNAYTYTINYYNHSDVGVASSTAANSLYYKVGNGSYEKVTTAASAAIATTEIYYDSMFNLSVSQKMTGYSFIGWGSEKYYDGSAYYSRFRRANESDEINTWYSSSVWFDSTAFFVNAGGYDETVKLSAQENMDLYLSLLNKYNGASPMPGGAFYTDGGYFMTDTGFKNGENSQNYNFYADYISTFSKHISQAMSELHNQANVNQGRTINLYGIWKANTYAIEYDVNNSKGDTFYVDYETKMFAYEFTSDKIGFRNVAKTEQEIKDRVTRLCYVIFDTNLWYSLSGKGDILMYSAMEDPYTISELCGASAVSKLAVDMFGYSWLGWSYTKRADINQGDSITDSTRVFDSYYTNQKNSSTLSVVPIFNKTFMDIMISAGTVFEFDGTGLPNSQKFVYYGMHKATTGLNAINGYVCFYDYSYKDTNGNASNTQVISAELSFNYVQTIDYLNTFRTSGSGDSAQILYSGNFTDSIVLSYYDTFMSSNCYSVRTNNERYSLTLTTNAQDVRRVKLFANWSQNKYTVKVDRLDNNTSYTSIYRLGSSIADNMFTSGGVYYFNNTNMMSDLLNRTQPTRIGYDFLGWSFNYIPPLEGSTYQSLISSVNAANQYLYLCKEMLAAYAVMNGATGTSELESNVLMIDGNRITGSVGTGWILNQTGKAEKLGDSEVDNTRYVYLFPIWKAQTFSINISLNITAQDLKNLHEKDSSFAIGLYNSAVESCTSAAGVNSNYYTFNKNSVTTSGVSDPSKFYYYYNDIVANVNFEIEFDQLFSTATCSFAGKTYYLKDLMMTSAGYYFMGLMINSTGTKDYVVRNLLRTTLELNGYVHHEEDEDVLTETNLYNNEDYLRYENITGGSDSDPDVFDLDAYNKLNNSKFNYSGSTPYYNNNGGMLKNNDYVSYSDGYGTYKNSSNFGTINFSAYTYGGATTKSRKYNIMSERDGSAYYLYIIHNNTKYYVVYYVSTGTTATAFQDVITSDKTYLYYNVKDASGNVLNRYIIRFNDAGQAYYIDNTFNNKKIITLKVALYSAKTNKLNLNISGSSSTIIVYNSVSARDGSLTGGNVGTTIYVIGSGNYELKNSAGREFTLFADWELRQIKSTVVNGNNSTSYNETTGATSTQPETSDNNPGLAGFYEIVQGSQYVYSSNSISSQNRISLSYDFYSDVNHILQPFFAGRYLSELTIEFDTLVEEGSTDSTSYKMKHNTIVFNFAWDNVNFRIVIASVVLNGIAATNAATSNDYTGSNHTGYKLNTISGIDILSFLDFRSLNYNASGDAGSGLVLYEKNGGVPHTSSQKRDYSNQVNVNLDKVMNSIKFTCKYSIQTYLVEVYTVVGDTDINGGVTSFASVAQMELASNKSSANMGLYGQPFLSNVNFSAGAIPTISTDCAKKLESYNVPFYYFITTGTSVGSNYKTDYGLNYIYERSLYKNGTSNATLNRSYGDLNKSELKLNSSAFTFQGWYSNPNESGSTVRLYDYSETTPITKNTVIYGYYKRAAAPTKVLFYYWDNEHNKYVQYTNNEEDYMTGGSCITGNKINKLPSPSIAPWYGDEDKHFIGYVYITNTIFGEFVMTGDEYVNEDYDSLKYNASNTFTSTRADIYSAFYMNRFGTNTKANLSSYINTHIKTITSPIDMFKYRLVVHNNKYFTASASINNRDVKVLDAVRLEVKVGSTETGIYTIYKDFKMLNVGTELPANQTVYAIPIYEEFKLQLNDIYTYKDKATITSNTNMIVSNVFETNANYTIYYDPRDIKVAVSASPGLTLQTISSATTYTLSEVKNPSGQTIFDYKQKEFSLGGSNKYVYVYYTKADQKTPFYMSNYVVARTGQVNVQVKLNEYNSPLEKELTGTYLDHYKKAFEAIQEDSSITGVKAPVIKANRQLVIYILLQLQQSYGSVLSYKETTAPIYYDSDGSKPDTAVNTSANKYSISETIRALNFNKLGISDSNLATHVNYDYYSIFRLAYSLAYYYVKENNINDGTGLSSLFGSNNMHSEYKDYAEDIISTMFGANTFTNNTIKPGDILVSYRHDTTLSKKTIYNIVTNDNKTVYAYDSFNEDEIDAKASFALYLYKTDSAVVVLDKEEGIITIPFASYYNNTKYQEDDKYQKFYHGTNDKITYDNGKETGYYTLNAEILVEEAVDGGDGYVYFKYDGSNTPYIKQGSYYYYKSTFETKWKAYQEQAKKYDEYLNNRDAWTAWEAYDKYDRYQKYLAYKEEDRLYRQELAAHQEWEAKDPETRGPEPYVRPIPTVVPYAASAPQAPYAEKPSQRLTEPTKPAGYVRNSSSTESVARTYVANNYDDFGLTRYTIKSSGTARYFAYASNGNQHSSYKKYYYYVADREYYKLANENNTDSRQVASSYGTGWDGPKASNNYWLIYSNGTKIYSRWKSFF